MRYFLSILSCLIGSSAIAQSYACRAITECADILEGCNATGYEDQVNIINFTDEMLTYNDATYGAIEVPVIATAKMANHTSYFFEFEEVSLLASLLNDGTLYVYAVNARDSAAAGIVTFSCEAVQ